MGGSGVGEQRSPCSSPRACSTNVHEDLPNRKRPRLFGKRTLHARVSAREFSAAPTECERFRRGSGISQCGLSQRETCSA